MPPVCDRVVNELQPRWDSAVAREIIVDLRPAPANLLPLAVASPCDATRAWPPHVRHISARSSFALLVDSDRSPSMRPRAPAPLATMSWGSSLGRRG